MSAGKICKESMTLRGNKNTLLNSSKFKEIHLSCRNVESMSFNNFKPLCENLLKFLLQVSCPCLQELLPLKLSQKRNSGYMNIKPYRNKPKKSRHQRGCLLKNLMNSSYFLLAIPVGKDAALLFIP